LDHAGNLWPHFGDLVGGNPPRQVLKDWGAALLDDHIADCGWALLPVSTPSAALGLRAATTGGKHERSCYQRRLAGAGQRIRNVRLHEGAPILLRVGNCKWGYWRAEHERKQAARLTLGSVRGCFLRTG